MKVIIVNLTALSSIYLCFCVSPLHHPAIEKQSEKHIKHTKRFQNDVNAAVTATTELRVEVSFFYEKNIDFAMKSFPLHEIHYFH